MGRIEEAKSNLHHALQLNPNHVGAQNNLKVIEYYQNKKPWPIKLPNHCNLESISSKLLFVQKHNLILSKNTSSL